jgi:two-component system phosphate regulon sensor histidine kinase PhoR
MEKRIKIIHLLTVMATVAFVAAQVYWLFNQYVYTLQLYEDELYAKILAVAAADRNLRKELQDENLYTTTRSEMKIEQHNNMVSDSKIEWLFDTYTINREEITDVEAITIRQIDSLSETGKGVKKYQFKIVVANGEQDVYDALDRFHVNEKCPFTTERFDSLLRTNDLKASSIQIETADSMVWNPNRINHTSFLHPTMEVTYPFNILQKQQFRVFYPLKIPPVLGRMLLPLFCSLVLSFLLIFCLLYQIKTIFKQQRIEELRKNFVHTMIHELKRPVATLKMCVSFMKNDKMMEDRAMKEDILRNSQNELDNLSSYFSKLRDMTYGELEEIPLNLSTFNLKELVERCVDKQNLPNNRAIHITVSFDTDNSTITADKIHIDNILCNLLENAVKYSEGETAIHISCRSVGDKYRLAVSDNGIGISSTDCDYVFDKFFRSERIVNKDIPGIGLGLSYVKLLVTAHKGNISLQSTEGTGSTFIIEIPEKQ